MHSKHGYRTHEEGNFLLGQSVLRQRALTELNSFLGLAPSNPYKNVTLTIGPSRTPTASSAPTRCARSPISPRFNTSSLGDARPGRPTPAPTPPPALQNSDISDVGLIQIVAPDDPRNQTLPQTTPPAPLPPSAATRRRRARACRLARCTSVCRCVTPPSVGRGDHDCLFFSLPPPPSTTLLLTFLERRYFAACRIRPLTMPTYVYPHKPQSFLSTTPWLV
ncbi:hypothetical protein B0H14DRAFT_3521895 [Mycena olivaceomarginata]|nr:hypothetical protein B0H14DRAFT_3521895 [Mycena olivaceomarginata]